MLEPKATAAHTTVYPLFKFREDHAVPQRKLLLADDSITIQKVVNLTFADEGFDVITVNNGDDALRRISEQRPDIILADVNIPGPNGYEICEMIRRIDEIKDLPVVLLVGSYEPFDPDKAQHVGANDFLTKPFSSIRQLVATVNNLLPELPVEKPAEQFPEAEEVASPDVDTLRMTEPRASEPVVSAETPALTPKESAPASTDSSPAASQEPGLGTDYIEDIENLYDQSLAATIEIPHEVTGQETTGEAKHEAGVDSPTPAPQTTGYELGDPGMDDEMIETAYVAETEAPASEVEAPPSPGYETEQPVAIESERPGGLGSSAGTEGASESYAQQPLELPPSGEQNFLQNLAERQPASYLSNEPENEALFEAEPEPEPEPEPESAGDEAMAFRAEEPVPSEGNGNGSYSHEAAEEPREEQPGMDAAPQPEQSTPWDSVAHPQPFSPSVQAASDQELEESDLLDLGEAGEPTPPTTWQESSIQDVGSPRFSDEVIDRIADRVVAKLSEQLVREIADRIVPDAVESFILKKFGRGEDR